MRYLIHLLLLAGLLFLSTTGRAFEPLFDARIDYPVKGYPTIADLDGDGDNDLAVVDASIITILLNNGHGTFATAATYESGVYAHLVVSADLDGDNDYDLVLVNRDGISVLANNGDGTFAEPVSHPAELSPQALFSADLDGDGVSDLVVANTGNVSIVLNNGDGTFASPVNYLEGSKPQSVFAADLDGDNDYDLAVGQTNQNGISILLNNGDGTFESLTSNPGVGTVVWSVFAADFDGDGDSDLAGGSGRNIAIILNNGDATFSEPISYPAHLWAGLIDVSDLDGDGDYDLAAVNYDNSEFNENRVSVLLNNGDGTFGSPIIYMRGRAIFPIISADLDGDNDNDLVMGSGWLNDRISVLLNKGDGTFPNPTRFGAGERGAAYSADLDGDGDLDIAMAHWGYGSEPGEWPPVLTPYCSFLIYLNDGDGSLDRYSNLGLHPEAHANSIVGADFDGDGDHDLAMGFTNAPSGVHVLSNNGDGTFKDPVEYAMGTNVTSICDADLDGDGDIDLATTGAGILLNNGDGTFMEPMESLPGNDIFPADLDGDGDRDLVIGRSSSILILKNNGDATFETTILDGLAGDDVSLTDLDNDYDYDLIIMNADAVDVSILLNNGNASFAAPINYNAGIFPDDIFTADLNGDGNIDIALAGREPKSSGLFCSFISVLINNGDGTFETPLNYGLKYWGIDELEYAGPDPIEMWITGADYDGDRDIDLAGDGYILFNRSSNPMPVVTVNLDIKPGSCPNPLNTPKKDKGNAVLPVAILGTDDFDVRKIVPVSITLNGVSPLKWGYEDVSTPTDKDAEGCGCTEDGADGYEDLTLKLDRGAIIAGLNTALHDEHAAMTAVAKNGVPPGNNAGNSINHGRAPIRSTHILRVEGVLIDGSTFEGYDCVILIDREELVKKPSGMSNGEVRLYSNSPNPFNPMTRIGFYLPEAGDVRLEVYNVLGQRVAVLIEQHIEAGDHTVEWDGSDCASGVYLYRFCAGDYAATKKMLLLK